MCRWLKPENDKEADFQRRIIARLKDKRVRIKSLTDKINAGYPDLVINWRGKYVEIELKRGLYKKPSLLQEINLMECNESGGYGFIAYTEKHIEDIIKYMANGVDKLHYLRYTKLNQYKEIQKQMKKETEQ